MNLDKIFGGTIRLLENSLDIRSRRHNVLVSNIANVDTPNYKAKDIIFENELKKTIGNDPFLNKTQTKHIPVNAGEGGKVRPAIIETHPMLLREDRNTVDIDKEMTKLAENNLMYNTSAEMLSKLFKLMKYSIRGEGR